MSPHVRVSVMALFHVAAILKRRIGSVESQNCVIIFHGIEYERRVGHPFVLGGPFLRKCPQPKELLKYAWPGGDAIAKQLYDCFESSSWASNGNGTSQRQLLFLWCQLRFRIDAAPGSSPTWISLGKRTFVAHLHEGEPAVKCGLTNARAAG